MLTGNVEEIIKLEKNHHLATIVVVIQPRNINDAKTSRPKFGK